MSARPLIRRIIGLPATVLRRARHAIGIAWPYGRVLGLNLIDRFAEHREESLLRKKVERGELTSVPCLVPFERLEFHQSGIVTSCCPAYTREVMVGDMRRDNIESIWNGPAMRRMRRRLLLGDTASICRPNCPFLTREPIRFDTIKTWNARRRHLRADLENGRTRLMAPPLYFNLANAGNCNLRCIMCSSNSSTSARDHVWKTYDNIKRYFGGELVLMLTGNGDPLARPDTRRLLMEFDPKAHLNVKFEILTNGLLWTASTWKKISHCRFGWINISVDAATAETYEKIRRGGRWSVLMENLEVIRQAFDAKKFAGVTINMTVMRSNYREIPAFVEIARRFGFNAAFAPIRGQYGDENIFELQDQTALKKLRAILNSIDTDDGTANLDGMICCFPSGWQTSPASQSVAG